MSDKCSYCGHLLLDHSKLGKGECQSSDGWGACSCPHWFDSEQEVIDFDAQTTRQGKCQT